MHVSLIFALNHGVLRYILQGLNSGWFWIIQCGRLHAILNTLWPGDAIWQYRAQSTLAQVMDCCLTAPSHYLKPCWLIISEVSWYSYSPDSFTGNAQDLWYEFKNDYIGITATPSRDHWVHMHLINCQTSNISHTLVGNKIFDHSDVVGAPPGGTAPTTSSFST